MKEIWNLDKNTTIFGVNCLIIIEIEEEWS